jgi:hypothetical protein
MKNKIKIYNALQIVSIFYTIMLALFCFNLIPLWFVTIISLTYIFTTFILLLFNN